MEGDELTFVEHSRVQFFTLPFYISDDDDCGGSLIDLTVSGGGGLDWLF